MTQSNKKPEFALLLDSGNTRLKATIYDINNKKFVVDTFAIEHTKLAEQGIKSFFNDIKIQYAIGVNVAGNIKKERINNVFHSLFNIRINWINVERFQSNVLNHYINIKQLGVDRWVSMVGLSKVTTARNQPNILASFGTATTIDTLIPNSLFKTFDNAPYLDQLKESDTNKQSIPNKIDWHFIGGTILPGPTLMANSLETNTANLPNATGPTSNFPVETYQAISSGIAGAQAGAVLRQWQAAYDEYKQPPMLYISGGGSSIVKQELQTAIKKAQALNNINACAVSELESPIMHGLATFIL